ncbi:MAG: hypothetical protein JWQ55_6410 [Rhodopila sp.]|nr:hypothetical protein [Rhodopila sp.]
MRVRSKVAWVAAALLGVLGLSSAVLLLEEGAPPQYAPPHYAAPAPAEGIPTPASPSPTPPPTIVSPLPAPVPAAPAPAETVDSVLKKLPAGAVAFNAPDHMRLAHTQTIEARLGVNVPSEQLVRDVTAEGKVRVVPLRVSPRMQATLVGGSAFEISPSGPQIQFISNEEANTWQWQITPKLEGQQNLALTFDVFIDVGGKEGLHTVNTLRQPITVDVGWPETPREWADWFKSWVDYGGWLWTALLLPVSLFLRREWRKFRPKPDVRS